MQSPRAPSRPRN